MPAERSLSLSFVLTAALLFALIQQLYGLARYDRTYDEFWHISWNERLVETGESERDSASNYISATPIVALNFAFLRLMWGDESITPIVKLKTLRYWQTFWLFVLGAAAVWVGTLLRDRELGFLFGTFVLLDPTLLAHSAVVTVDLACAATILVQAGAALWYLEQPQLLRALLLGLAAGVAIVAKFTSLLLIPSYLLLPVFAARRLVGDGASIRVAAHFVAAAGVGCLAISAFYGFSDVFAPLSTIPWRSGIFSDIAAIFPSLRLPLPAALLTGIDRTLQAERHQLWNVVLLGASYPHGTMMYFPVLWALKTPVALLVFMLFGWTRFIVNRPTKHSLGVGFFLLQSLLLAGYFLLLFRTQVGYRYALSFIPLLIGIAALGWPPIRSPRTFFAATALAALTAAESVPFSGNLLAFSNLFLQPKAESYRYFADSNLDWGQNTEQLAPVIVEEAKLGAKYNPLHILPGRNLIEVNTLAGVWQNFNQHRWVREHLHPVRDWDYTLVEFEVGESDFNRFIAAERVVDGAQATLSRCAVTAEAISLDALEKTSIPQGTQSLCIDAAEPTVIKLRSTLTDIIVGPLERNNTCRRERIGAGGEAWFVLPPGKFEFCIENNSDLPQLEVISGMLRVSMHR